MNSLPNEAGKPRGPRSRWLALAMCLAVGALSIHQAWNFQPGPNEQQIAMAEDEVYEAVVRDIVPKLGQNPGMRLVFDDNLIVGDFPGGDATACREASGAPVLITGDAPMSSAETQKAFRLWSRVWHDTPPASEAVQDYLQRSCIGGSLSRSFRTDVPHSFVGDLSSDRILPSAEDPKFARLFPGASGVIGFSHVGFNKLLDEAIVSTSFHCGGLCGGGTRYFLKRVYGRWKIVSKTTIWVS
ncbi:MAG TPA: hypothetical protein VN025_04715 [Candidatus Dormibacteraeota bacterium]|jgi:hypothetical protein|nr:hypothetical protein [Candidatus Dormibacteraeota bacterium]